MEGEGRGLGASCLPSKQRPEWGHINRGEKRVYFCVIIKNFYKLLRSFFFIGRRKLKSPRDIPLLA